MALGAGAGAAGLFANYLYMYRIKNVGILIEEGSIELSKSSFIDIEGYGDPNSVLVKALLLNGCEDMGYGKVG